ncbi:MAG: carboxypeptidase-like regulatory domain-containing protein [Longimicrobiales bacterium]
MPRALLIPLLLGLLITACAPVGDPRPQAQHNIEVTVTAGGQPVPGIVVTVTNVNSGTYDLALSNSAGVARFSVPDGRYLAHARNLEDTGPANAAVPLPLSLAPLPDGEQPLSTGTAERQNRIGVLYDDQSPNPVELTPQNYDRLTRSPRIRLSGAPSTTNITLDMPTGATIRCELLDPNGQPVTAAAAENVMLIFAHPASSHLPPLPPPLATFPLKRAILHGAATIPGRSSTCSLAGVPATNGFNAVLQTNRVTDAASGTQYIFTAGVNVTQQNATDGDTLPIRMTAQPPRVAIRYLVDPPGDAGGGADLGIVTYGWEEREDRFTVAAHFSPAGGATLTVHSFTAGRRSEVQARIDCSRGPCRPDPTQTDQVLSYGFADPSGATAVWRVALPGADSVQFRVEAGRDVAPDMDFATSSRETPPGNTWLIPGD